MNRTRLLMIGFVALALGAFVSLTVYKNLQSKSAANQPGMDVAVAAHDIEVGSKLADGDVVLVKIPIGAVPPTAYHRKSQIVGRGVILPIAKGDYVLQSKLAPESAGSGLPSLIPTGMRAVSVRVNEVVSVAGFVQPGTRVDVLVTGNPVGASEPQTTTVLQNVFVIAAGQKLERSSAGEPQNVPVITLLLSPDDAQKLTLAQSQGMKIQLSLRNPIDTKQPDLDPARQNALFKGAPAPTMPHVKSTKKVVPAPAAAPPPYTVQIIKGKDRKDVTVESQ